MKRTRIILRWGNREVEIPNDETAHGDMDEAKPIDLSKCTLTIREHKPSLSERIARGPRSKDTPEKN